MKIPQIRRVVYANNPLAEVVCQLKFEFNCPLDKTALDSFRASLADSGYTIFNEERAFCVSVQISGTENQASPVNVPESIIYHFSTADGAWRLSVSQEFIALSCSKYSRWRYFESRIAEGFMAFERHFGAPAIARIGLRYKDVIDREALDINEAPWHELIQPFLLGPLSPGALCPGEVLADSDVATLISQALIRLDDCMLLLQSSLLTSMSGDKRAFLIDSDFFVGADSLNPTKSPIEYIPVILNRLHENAGALFQQCIMEKLHHALDPSFSE